MRTSITLVLLCTFLSTSVAQVFVNVNATGNNNGSSWEDAFTNLQDAFDESPNGAAIWIAAGTYTPLPGPTPDSTRFIAGGAFDIYGGFNGTETMLDERDWETNVTILSGDINGDDNQGDYFTNRTDNARNVLITISAPSDAIIDGISIIGGNGRLDDIPQDAIDFFPWFGGGLLMIGDTEVRNCSFSENVGSIGGALFVGFGSTEDFLIDNCFFGSNYSNFGGIRVQSTESTIIQNSTFDGNTALTFGAAICLGNANATIEDCSFQNNVVEQSIGGGLFFFQNASSSISSPLIEVKRCDFESNQAPIGAGLAFNNFFPESQIVIDSCYFSENVSINSTGNGFGAGLAIRNLEDGFGGTMPSLSVDIQNSVIENNEADFSGGLYFSSFSDFSTLNVSNSLFNENEASQDFGAIGIFNFDVLVDVEFSNVVFKDNATTGVGGGLALFNSASENQMEYEIDNCIFIGNQADEEGGAIWSSTSDLGSIGIIRNSLFSENGGGACCGAISSSGEDILIDQTVFEENETEATNPFVNGGGAIGFNLSENARIQNSIFENNSSEEDGAAILATGGTSKVYIENTLINSNFGNAAVTNTDSLWMTNVTIINNEIGLSQKEGFTQVQNTVFSSEVMNYLDVDSTGSIISMGGNLSSDGSMENALTGFGGYEDFNNTSPNLGLDFVPLETSDCVDAGNPTGVSALTDLAGLDRIQGTGIDIGAFESSFVIAVRDLNVLQIEVYPNPFAENIQLSDLEGIEQVRLLDGAGRLVQVLPIESTLYINKTLAQGIYYLEVQIGNRLYFKKLKKG